MTRAGGAGAILDIARMRWEEHLTQVEIARRLGVSEATVSRALKRAIEQGIVEIRLAPGVLRQPDLERRLVQRFDLESAVVVETRADPRETRRLLGGAVARLLDGLIEPAATIGVSDGETTAAVAEAAIRTRAPEVGVVTLIGGVGESEQPSHPGEVSRRLARNLGARVWDLPVPAIVDDPRTAARLRETTTVRAAFARMERLSIALVGVGATTGEAAIVRHGLVSAEDMRHAAAAGAVGTICARFYDGEGRPTPAPVEDRLLAITREQLMLARHRVAVAFGREKARAIAAALLAGWANQLGTDAETAESLLPAQRSASARLLRGGGRRR